MLVVNILYVLSGCVLRTLQLLEMIDPVGYHSDILSLFDIIIEVDPYHKGYYYDISKK